MSRLSLLIIVSSLYVFNALLGQQVDGIPSKISDTCLPSANDQDTSEKLKNIRAIIQSQVKEQHFEGTILIAEKEELLFHEAYGFRDRAKLLSNEMDTRFGIASITKMITAMIVLQLVEEGKLKVSNEIQALLPELSIPKGDQITLHHLLLHISGLPNEPNSYYLEPRTPILFVNDLLEKHKKNERFGQYNYANIDYVLLGLVIEKTTGKPWQAVVEDRFIDRLKLDNTGFLVKGAYPENFAQSYSLQGELLVRDPDFYIENFYAAGSMYSTADDLWKIDQAMHTNVLLNATSKKLLYTSYPEYNYTGYSVWTYHYPYAENKPRIMERRGGIMGSNSVLIRFLDTQQTIIILSNNDGFNPDSFGDPENLREALIQALGKEWGN